VIQPVLKQHFKRDEFLGRINEMLFFLPFTDVQLQSLVEQELNRWAKNAKKRHHMTLTWDNDVPCAMTKAYNVRYGARSLQHEVERQVISRLAKAHEQDLIGNASSIHLFIDESDPQCVQLRFENKQSKNSQQQQNNNHNNSHNKSNNNKKEDSSSSSGNEL